MSRLIKTKKGTDENSVLALGSGLGEHDDGRALRQNLVSQTSRNPCSTAIEASTWVQLHNPPPDWQPG